MASIPVHTTSSLKIRSQRTDALVIVSVNKQFYVTVFYKFDKNNFGHDTFAFFLFTALRMPHIPGKNRVTGEKQVFLQVMYSTS